MAVAEPVLTKADYNPNLVILNLFQDLQRPNTGPWTSNRVPTS